MLKNPHATWQHHKEGLKMQRTVFGNTPQDLYFPEDHPTMPGWFKWMETIIHE